ncbi:MULTISPECIES: hypothetical protein [unclassified Mucilaginibacter]|uniref:hypothetical protein n=1 Tax=unclassified Mucilaginibacter TaxID=2617802 RepID=UPI002AC957A1|nr:MULTISPECIES: hypothetical protein [unclassified Mucilaginibacter]MEB0263092.1 hypothetical protein [Mucilaginibacter sp. 10I4]MEB0277772.1 hypothetical protein [Mucilaginibacter sp. 10B2]MEB0301906.1 hypothetical protein [Mucilaginibacter sp. 5C4]WPX24604.1 hypothetical protein RHM67_04865 [Mucilaginibacter sp. 5C4]
MQSRKPVWQTLGLGAVAGVRASAAPAIANYYSNGFHSSSLSIVRFVHAPITSIATSLLSAAEKERKRSAKTTDHIDMRQLGLHVASGAFAGAAIFRKNKQSIFKGMLIGGAAALLTGVAGFYIRKHADKLPDIVPQFTGAFTDAFAFSSGVTL